MIDSWAKVKDITVKKMEATYHGATYELIFEEKKSELKKHETVTDFWLRCKDYCHIIYCYGLLDVSIDRFADIALGNLEEYVKYYWEEMRN